MLKENRLFPQRNDFLHGEKHCQEQQENGKSKLGSTVDRGQEGIQCDGSGLVTVCPRYGNNHLVHRVKVQVVVCHVAGSLFRKN